MTAEELAFFNFETADRDDIDEHLVFEVGCTEKTDDESQYVFTDDDDPGILFVPEPWKIKGLSTGGRHIIRAEPKHHVELSGEFLFTL